MRFGFMVLPRDADDVREAARIGEAMGFDWMGVADTPVVYQESYLHQREAASVTERIRIGPMTGHLVVRHPVIVANLLATLNEMNGGRTVGCIATGNSAARGLGLKPAKLADMVEGFAAIRGCWKGEGGKFKESLIPASGIHRQPCPLIMGADGPKAAEAAGNDISDGILYGGPMVPEVQRRRLAAGKKRPEQEAWIAPIPSLAATRQEAREELGALVVAMANRGIRGDLDERGLPPEIQEDMRALWGSYDYSRHADTTRPLNAGKVTQRLGDWLTDALTIWGDEERWNETLLGIAETGWDGVHFILGQGVQAPVVKAIGERLHALGLMEPA
jgi:alkanesulfonate monooxygenase SsuD/methylene tetrahydromethanopterin reductase-like flavin-dependent oxidoreductase (luciferase family)